MPWIKPPGTLKQQCVCNIANHMDDIWCKDYVENWMKQANKYLYILGPFHDLPSNLVEMVINELDSKKKLRKHHLHLLLVYHLDRMVLNRETQQFAYSMTLLSTQCKKIRHLGLRNSHLPRNSLNNVIMSLPILQVLDLSGAQVQDQTLSVCAAYCKHLRELVLRDTSVSDMGIMSLCLGVNNSFIDPTEQPPIANMLLKLDLTGTQVTEYGVQCAFENLKNMQYLLHSATLQALNNLVKQRERMVEEALDMALEIPTYELLRQRILISELYGNESCDGSTDAGIIPQAVSVCPELHSVRLHAIINIQSNSFLPLTTFNNLTNLTLHLKDGSTFDFEKLILPVLKIQGEWLLHLELASVQEINILLIAHLCPKLENLILLDNKAFSSVCVSHILGNKINVRNIFAKLRDITIGVFNEDISEEHENNQVPKDILKLLLSSPSLENVNLSSQDSLNDEMIISVVCDSGLSNISTFVLQMCDNISQEAIWTLLTMNNPLKKLFLINCQEITIRDYEDMLKYVKKSKFQMHIEWK